MKLTIFKKLNNLDKIRTGRVLATNKDGSILGNTLNFNTPVSSAVAIHLGSNPIDTNIVLESPASVLDEGVIRFKSSYISAITVCYIVVLK